MDKDLLKIIPPEIKKHIFLYIYYNNCVVCNKYVIHYENHNNYTCCFLCKTIHTLDTFPTILVDYSSDILINTTNNIIIIYFTILLFIASILNIIFLSIIFSLTMVFFVIFSTIINFYLLITKILVFLLKSVFIKKIKLI